MVEPAELVDSPPSMMISSGFSGANGAGGACCWVDVECHL